MLEGLVAWVLNTYLGKYVENLNTHQLSIALLQGEVELENLPLRKDALRHFGLPIQVRAGFIGKIKLQIPVRAIRSAPWVILIEQLYLVAGPVRLNEWDEEAEENAAQEYKLSTLDALEAQWRAEFDNQGSSYYASSYSSWLSYGTSVVTNVVENLQLKITDVHIRYEDDVTVPNEAFAFGITLDTLSAQSCDDTWQPRYLSGDSGLNSFKLLELSALGVYWNKLDSDGLLGDLSLGELAVALSQVGVKCKSHNFLLSPVSAQAHVKRNRSELPLRSRLEPRIVCDLHLEEVPLSLYDWQYGQMVGCLKGLQSIERIRRHRKYRPECTVKDDPKAWWVYLTRCHFPRLYQRKNASTWDDVLKLARENVAYVTTYEQLLSNPSVTLSPKSKEMKDAVELARPLEDLQVLREVAMRHVRPPTASTERTSTSYTNASGSSAGMGILFQWFPAWWGWSQSNASPDSSTSFDYQESSMEQQIEGQILDALADSVENNTLLRRDVVFGQINFTLKEGTFHLCSSVRDTQPEEPSQGDAKKSVLELQFENVQLNWESRPRSSSQRISVSLGALYIWDKLTKDTVFPVLVAPQGHDSAPSALASRGPRAFPPGLQRLRNQGNASMGMTSTPYAARRTSQTEESLFELVYEHKPFNSSCDYRLHVRSQSLDVVYNPMAVEWLTNFFTQPYQQLDWTLRQAARHGYQAMKRRTRQELMRNWDELLEGHLSNRKIWELELNISAPQIIFVEHFCDKNAVIAVVDFGRFHLNTQDHHKIETQPNPPLITTTRDSDDEDDAFQTPCSTPPGSAASESESDREEMIDETLNSQLSVDPNKEGLSEWSLHHRLYDRYTVEFGDLQILVGKVKDNWKYAHLKGTSTLHVLDRFNISLQIERRVVFTRDPQFPSLTVSGNLPKLVVHVNETKIEALRTMVDIISGRGLPSPFRSQEPSVPGEDMGSNEAEDFLAEEKDDKSEKSLSRLVMLQFSVDQMALEVQSRGRSIAELQVSGVRASFTKRPFDTSVSLSVHSLLLVDALQTFGPDFELLVASHKHVGMDSVSGSLRDSEPTSPTSPGSPSPDVQSPRTTKLTTPLALSQALTSLQYDSSGPRAVSPSWSVPSPPPMITSPQFVPGGLSARASYIGLDTFDHEALITIEIILVSPDCPTNNDPNVDSLKEALQIVSVQFNNLDIIANQETIVELIGFTRRVFPQLKHSKRFTSSHVPRSSSPSSRSASHPRAENASHSPSPSASAQAPHGHPSTDHVLGSSATTARTELTFDFHRLNVLLLRAVLKDNVHVGRKIATATMSEAKIHATIGQQLVVGGSLGGLQVLDLTPEGQKHQRILSLGKDPLVTERTPDIASCLGADLYTMGQPPVGSCPEEKQVQAFSFSVSRSLSNGAASGAYSSAGMTTTEQKAEAVDVKIRMASVLYTHSPCLVNELGSCASEFKQYLSNLAHSIKSAATEMALGLVHARAEALAQSLYMSNRLSTSFYGGSGSELSSPKRRRRSVSRSSDVYESMPNTANPSVCNTKGNVTPTSPGEGEDDSQSSAIDLRLDVVLDTPVVVMPRSATSSGVLVAHLGKISINNIPDNNQPGIQDSQEHPWGFGQSREQYSIEIRDMNLFSLDTSKTFENAKKLGGFLAHGHVDGLLRAEQLYACTEDGVPILHDTVIKLEVERVMGCGMMQKADSLSSLLLDDTSADLQEYQSQDRLQISGSVVTPLKVSLSRQQYEQVLDTVNSLLMGTTQLSMGPSVVSNPHLPQGQNAAATPSRVPLGDIAEEESEINTGVSTLSMDSTLRARMLLQGPPSIEYQRPAPPHRVTIKVSFELPIFTLELKGDLGRGEQGLVDLSCSDFKLQFERLRPYETLIEMSLKSLLMEDLLQTPDSKHRFLLVSSNGSDLGRNQYCDVPAFVSKSCPNLSGNINGPSNFLHQNFHRHQHHHGSLPDHLENESAFVSSQTKVRHRQTRKAAPSVVGEYPSTPPPSPQHHSSGRLMRDDTLVRINMVLVDRNAPKLTSLFNNIHRSISVDFNTLDVIVNVESWVVILDFFGFGPTTPSSQPKEPSTKAHGTAETPEAIQSDNTKLELEIWSLTLVLNRPEYEVARANVSQLSATVVNRNNNLSLDGRLGKMSLMDATPHSAFYRERFISSGSEALNVHYFKFGALDPTLKRDYDSQLRIEMSSVLYVHTQRFLAEINAFFRHFSQLQSVLINIRSSSQVQQETGRRSRRLLLVTAGSPVLLLPLSSHSTEILVADLGKLSITNKFLYAASEGTISKVCAEPDVEKAWPLLDVMQIDLANMDLYAGQRSPATDNLRETGSLYLGSFVVTKKGPSLLREKCQLKLQLESNLDSGISHAVPDMSVRGTLSKLSAAVDLSQYRLIRGLLSYNIGECLDDVDVMVTDTSLNTSSQSALNAQCADNVWMLLSIHLDLVDVTLKLQLSHGPEPWCDLSPGQTHIPSQGEGESSLACINFIKSRLTVEIYSDKSQDVDLVSQEILITDTRYQDEPVNKRSNVFTNILQPINMSSSKDMVQAEIHHRKRRDYSKFTILLNSMRLMAILDWWEVIKNFISENAENPFPDVERINVCSTRPIPTDIAEAVQTVPYELKLNITASEVVVVEDTSQWDANAVILKSTTVVSFKPGQEVEPLSCNFNHCEVFSCVLGMEDETALSIIDPVTINMDLKCQSTDDDSESEEHVLVIQTTQQLNVRLSYHDVRMFTQMLSSLKHQTMSARNPEMKVNCRPANFSSQVHKLSALGFETEDCAQALDKCDGKLDEAALWLTQHAVNRPHLSISEQTSALSFQLIQISLKCLSICVIDDCRDADVPLLELSLSSLNAEQRYGSTESCKIEGILAGDYYNRVLSGWEPCIEPWPFQTLWEHVTNSGGEQTGITVKSDNILNLNVTSTLVELYKAVKENWTEDYYCTNNSRVPGSPSGHRRRSPFVPFALRNDTGSRVFFTTRVTSADRVANSSSDDNNIRWVPVAPGATVPFSFEERGKLRHQNTHKYKIHQLGVCVEGWRPIPPISVDKVGIYFRPAVPDAQRSVEERLLKRLPPGSGDHLDLPGARVVLEVTLEGSAQKLVIVRSALLVRNHLQDPVELRLENTLLQGSAWAGVKTIQIAPQSVMPIPLTHALAQLWVRPVTGSYHAFSTHPISWTAVTKPGETMEELHSCQANRGINYKFCAAVTRENYPVERTGLWVQPAHTISLLCCVTIVNLLPYDLHYTVVSKLLPVSKASGVIKPGGQDPVREVDIDGSLEFSFHLDNFPGAGTLVLPPMPTSSFTQRLRLRDLSSRRLFLQASVNLKKGAAIKVVVWAPYWIVNKTGLPVVFRQEGVPEETAGQFAEHEVARMVAPLLFSYSDHEASPTIVARVGNGVHPEGIPQWCDNFHLDPSVQFCKLIVSFRESRPDVMYVMGVEVKTGRGRYRNTNIVTLSPHYQLFNRSSYKLQFAQKHFATTLSDPGAQATYLTAVPNCCLPFHWPRQEKEQLLCVRLLAVPNCLWSGGFRINVTDSLHINIRDRDGRMYFLRLEIFLQGATYFVVFSDANTMPPPIRIDNYSEVPLLFYQSCVQVESLQWSIRPHLSMPYAWDEPTQAPSISLVAPGGATALYDMNGLGRGRDLTYENFIYIAFTGTFKHVSDGPFNPLDVESQQLVLDVLPGSTRVVLARKEQGARSQLWRMTGEGQLQHEGSSPPRDPHRSHIFGGVSSSSSHSDKILVLDIAGPAPQPSQYVGLTLRRVDNRRKSTQTWRFTEDGRLCCAHNNMCVQAKDGFFGLRQGTLRASGARWQQWCEAVLGPPQPVTHRLTEEGVPLEQAVSRQRLRPGSGFLAVNVLTDGPTRVLEITDIKQKQKYALLEERDWAHISATQRPSLLHDEADRQTPSGHANMNMCLLLDQGLGVSIVSRQPPEELVYIRLVGISLELQLGSDSQKLTARVDDIQVDNQLYNAQCPVLLYVNPAVAKREDTDTPQPAIVFAAERVTSPNINAEIFKYLKIVITRLCLSIEESLLLKLVIWAGYKQTSQIQEDVDESEFETQRILSEATSVHAKRYYFGHLQLMPSEFRLSLFTSSKLPQELQAVKRKLGLRFIKFEDACVDLGGFIKQHPFETSQFLFSSIIKHYQEMLKWRAYNILGSSDFLGNPAALASDVSVGVSGLFTEGDVKTLVKNVAHGISNSTAKFTESLGDGLGHVIMDEQHEEARRRMRGGSTFMEHVASGLKGFGFGVLGGITSVVKQPWDGAMSDGVPGFVAGFGKGLVGTVTKPVIGILDLTSEGASAFRELCRDSSRLSPTRFRVPRCVVGPGGLLPPFSAKQSEGQEYLYSINERNYAEILMAYEVLLSGMEDLRILVSSEKVRVFSCAGSQSGGQSNATVVLQAHLSDLLECQHVSKIDGPNTLHFIELTIRADIGSGASGTSSHEPSFKRPLVRCTSERVAVWVSQQVNYAKEMFEERRYTLLKSSSNFLDD